MSATFTAKWFQNLPNRHVTAHTEIGRVEDLICRRVGKDRLGVDTGFVGKGAEASDVVVARNPSALSTDVSTGNSQRHLDLNGLGDKVLNLTKHGKVVLGLDVFRVSDHHTGNKTTKRGDAVTLSDTELIGSANNRTICRVLTTEVSMWVAPASRAA